MDANVANNGKIENSSSVESISGGLIPTNQQILANRTLDTFSSPTKKTDLQGDLLSEYA